MYGRAESDYRVMEEKNGLGESRYFIEWKERHSILNPFTRWHWERLGRIKKYGDQFTIVSARDIGYPSPEAAEADIAENINRIKKQVRDTQEAEKKIQWSKPRPVPPKDVRDAMKEIEEMLKQ